MAQPDDPVLLGANHEVGPFWGHKNPNRQGRGSLLKSKSPCQFDKGNGHGPLTMALPPFLEGPQSAAGAGLLTLLADGL
jgi:hypothetical protein